ncbi:MAG: GxxExxY protein, partial [Acetobacteraceae bacterium]
MAVDAHRRLGPGLLESAYETCLSFELEQAGIAFERQAKVPIVYRETRLDAGFRADLVIAETVIVGIKSVGAIAAIHEAQLLTYLRLSGYRVG